MKKYLFKLIIYNTVNIRREYLSMINIVYTRRFSRGLKDWALIKQSIKNNEADKSPYELAIKYIKGNEPITAAKINNVLTNVSITQDILDEILSKPRINFEILNVDIINSDEFKKSVGTIRNEGYLAGVYIWTHKVSGAKYVGSSSSLARRLIGYFKGTHEDVGKFIPLLKKEGVEAFNLQIIPLKEKYYNSLEICLEQYFLLHPQFNLNTLKVANKISGSRSKALYMYTGDFSELIYLSDNQEDFIFNLKIHHSIFSDSIQKGTRYLGKYIFTDHPISGAKDSLKSVEEVLSLLEKDRLKEKVGRKIIIRSDNDEKVFNSIKDYLVFLNNIAPSNKTTLYRCIESGKPYQGFICEWIDKKTISFLDRGIEVIVIDTFTNERLVYPTIRKAALSFLPDINTTGQTIKGYANKEKLFKNRYLIKISSLG